MFGTTDIDHKCIIIALESRVSLFRISCKPQIFSTEVLHIKENYILFTLNEQFYSLWLYLDVTGMSGKSNNQNPTGSYSLRILILGVCILLRVWDQGEGVSVYATLLQ
jgi:hypothetical protein